MSRRQLVRICVLGIIFLSACRGEDLATPEPSPPPELPTATNTPPSQPSNPTVATAVSLFGPETFAADLPEGWDISGPEINNSDPTRPYEVYLMGPGPLGSGGPGMSRVIIAKASEWTPEELARAQCSTCTPPIFESVAVGTQLGQRTQIGGGGVPILVTWTYVENKGKLIGLAIHDPETLEPLLEVIESIQFQ